MLSQTEQDMIKEAMSSPVVVKYLNILYEGIKNEALSDLTGFLGDSEEFVRRKFYLRGKKDTLDTLLSLSQTEE